MSTAAVVVAEATKTEVDAAPISEDAKARVKAAGITHLTPVQERTLRAVIVSGRDVLVQAPTGSGKTLAYLLPLAHALAAEDASGPCDATPHAPGLPSAIVFLPTRELAAQVFAHAEAHVSAAGFPCVLCVGGVPEAPQMAAIASGRGRVVVGTPGRVKEFFDRGAIRTDALIVQVLDEADRLLDGGFEQDVEAVMRPPGGRCRTMCLSATMPPRLARFLQRRLPPNHAEVSLHGRGGGNVGGAVEHLALTCHPDDAIGTILAAVDAYAPKGGAGAEGGEESGRGAGGNSPVAAARGQAIVFVETKAAAERLAGTLAIAYEERGASDASAGRRRRRVSSLHGNLPQPARDAALRSLREGACDVLVATDVAARGLDLAGVELVVHADAPGCADAYAHRAGRAGRPGCAARGVSLLLPAPGKDAAAALAALERDARVCIRRLTVIGETRARGRDAATAAAASAAAAARRDAFDADAGAAASSRSAVAKKSAGAVFTTSVPRRVGSGSGVSGVSGVFSDDETARAREGERILVAGRFDDLAGELGELRGGRAVGGGASKGGKRGKSRR